MNLKGILKKNLTGVMLAGSLLSTGCASSNAAMAGNNLTRQTYAYDYDEATTELAVALYAFKHNGERPTTQEQVSFYSWVPRDINENGVLDFHREVTVTRNGDRVMELYERVINRAQATDNGKEDVSELRLVRNEDDTWTRTATSTVNLSDEMLENQLSGYTQGQYQHEIDETGRAHDEFMEHMRQQQNPSTRPLSSGQL